MMPKAHGVPRALAPMTQVRSLDSGAHSDLVRVIVQSDGPGIVETPGSWRPLVAVHLGRPVRLECRHGTESHAGVAIHGDIDIVPAGVPARWEMKETDTALVLALAPALINRIAEASGRDEANGVEVRSRFQIRDPQIEHIGLALKADVEQGYPGGTLYMDSMATALAVRLLRRHSSRGGEPVLPAGGLSPRTLRRVLSYIEDNLRHALSLQAIANAAGLSVSHLKVLFHRSVGSPVHQYVVRRRVDRAALLLRQTRLPISQIALDAGFAHQSHMAMHMRRILGVSPGELRRCAW
jgi:AraC family transcriptional regulator